MDTLNNYWLQCTNIYRKHFRDSNVHGIMCQIDTNSYTAITDLIVFQSNVVAVCQRTVTSKRSKEQQHH